MRCATVFTTASRPSNNSHSLYICLITRLPHHADVAVSHAGYLESIKRTAGERAVGLALVPFQSQRQAGSAVQRRHLQPASLDLDITSQPLSSDVRAALQGSQVSQRSRSSKTVCRLGWGMLTCPCCVYSLHNSTSVGFLFPVYSSYKAIRANEQDAIESWLMYWVVMAGLHAVENTVEWAVNWLVILKYRFLTTC